MFDGEKKEPYCETDLPHPINAYGQTKLAGENFILETGCKFLIIRTSWLFGIGGINFISKILSHMQEKKELHVIEDQYSKPTCCNDLAKATIELLPLEGFFHFANPQATNLYAYSCYVHQAALHAGMQLFCQKIFPIKSCDYFCLAKRPKFSVLDTEKVEGVLGDHPKSWQQQVDMCLKEYQKLLCH